MPLSCWVNEWKGKSDWIEFRIPGQGLAWALNIAYGDNKKAVIVATEEGLTIFPGHYDENHDFFNRDPIFNMSAKN